jgi:CRP-like cAMP-binding protein
MLRAVPVLSDEYLSFSDRAALCDALRRERWAPGEAIARQGRTLPGLALVEAGRALAHQRSRGEDVRVLATFSRGAFFGEAALLREVRSAATITARDATATLALDGETLRRALEGRRGRRGPTLERMRASRLAEMDAARPGPGPGPGPGGDGSSADPEGFLRAKGEDGTAAAGEDVGGADGSGAPGTEADAEAARRRVLGVAPGAFPGASPAERGELVRALAEAMRRWAPFAGPPPEATAGVAAACVAAFRARPLRRGETWVARGDRARVAAVVAPGGALRTLAPGGASGGASGDFAGEHLEVPDEDPDDETLSLEEERANSIGGSRAEKDEDARAGGPGPAALAGASSIAAGVLFGGDALLHPDARWAVTVVAAAPTVAWELSARAFAASGGFRVVEAKRARFAPLLDDVAALRRLTPRQRRRAADALVPVAARPGERLAVAGTPAEGVFIVEKGVARETADDARGAREEARMSGSGRNTERRTLNAAAVCDDQGSEAAARPSEVRAFYWSAPPRTFRRGEIFGEDAAAAPPGAKTNSRRTVVVASARCEGAGSAGGSRGGGRREGGGLGARRGGGGRLGDGEVRETHARRARPARVPPARALEVRRPGSGARGRRRRGWMRDRS